MSTYQCFCETIRVLRGVQSQPWQHAFHPLSPLALSPETATPCYTSHPNRHPPIPASNITAELLSETSATVYSFWNKTMVSSIFITQSLHKDGAGWVPDSWLLPKRVLSDIISCERRWKFWNKLQYHWGTRCRGKRNLPHAKAVKIQQSLVRNVSSRCGVWYIRAELNWNWITVSFAAFDSPLEMGKIKPHLIHRK